MAEGTPIKKVLIIRFSSLGDIVLTSLLIRCLKKQKQCQIHYLTKQTFAPLVSSNPYINKVWTTEAGMGTLLPLLKAEQFDLMVDLHNNLRSHRFRFGLWKVQVVSYHKANLAKWLAVYFKKFRFPKEHVALRYLNALKRFGLKDDGDGLDYFIPDADHIDVSKYFGFSGPFLALVIGAAHFTKRIPIVKLKELLTSFDPAMNIVLIGGKEEYAVAAQLSRPHIYNACGTMSVNQSASILQQAHTVIAPDTGMMHIAAAFKKKIRSIWGSTLQEFGFWPFYGDKHPDQNLVFEIEGLPCRPCSRFGRHACPKGHFKCMLDHDMSAVSRSISMI
ncbi:MAG: glycosyltransferase family 9 protein [Saprospiraceae bacterium]|nr:glycosyltransferase family 9 protein [Saprospiraceae bacterium]